MRLFLSSLRLGPNPERFRGLVGSGGRVAVIGNALDAWPEPARDTAVRSEYAALSRLGFVPDELDLRRFTDDAPALRQRLAGYAAVWIRGGNAFVLRAQMARSGADTGIRDLVTSDRIVYGGYSAGACVATPTLRGLETVDDPRELADTVPGGAVVWDGLGLVDRRIVPHFGVPEYPEAAAITELARQWRKADVPHWTLGDDQALIVTDERIDLI